MAINLYLMPQTGDGLTQATAFRPKYDSSINGVAASAKYMDYGAEQIFLVAAVDMPPAAHTALIANLDVTAFPSDLSQTIGGQLTGVQNALEALNLPSGWVTSGMTYLTVAKYVEIFFYLMQRLRGQGQGKVFGTVTLDTTFGSLPAGVKTKLQAMAASFNFDTTSLTGASTIRQIMKALADQWTLGSGLGLS